MAKAYSVSFGATKGLAVVANGSSEEEISVAGDAFEADMNAMQVELTAAKTAAGADTVKANADADVIQAKYQAKADAFAGVFTAFITANPTLIPAEVAPTVTAKIKEAPAQIRAGIMAAPAAPATAPAS